MKKFTDLSSNNNKVEDVKTTRQLIESVIDETLKIKDDNIDGKTVLVDILEKMFNMNSIKTTVKVLENVKALTYKGLDLKMLNEAIDYNKNQLNTNESVEIELDELTKLSNMCTTIINESKIVDEKDKEKTKEKVIDYLIKAGNNENDVNEMVEKLFDEAFETYHTVKTISDYIRTNY